MKIAVFNGSPRGRKSNTHKMVAEFLKGASEAGAVTENVFLCEKKIHHCVGCFSCWTKTPGVCVFHDDMEQLLELVKESDMIVFASPIYVGSVTGIMKDFLDRSLPLADPHFEKNENGISKHPSRGGKRADVALISNCGFPEQTHFRYFRSIFDFMEENNGANIVAEIYRSQGPLLEADSEQLKPVIDEYFSLLRQAGREVVKDGRLSKETRAKLEEPLIPADLYLQHGNAYWDKMLSEVEKKTC